MKPWFSLWTFVFVILLAPIGAAQNAWRIVGVERNRRTLRRLSGPRPEGS